MQRYRNLAGDSGVTHYALGAGHIDIRFRNGVTYRYDERTPGPRAVATMKRLAAAGAGLSTFISTHVKDRYARKLA